mgnify:CR=1 FL=1
MEGELARTISSIDAVRSANVHLVIPESDLFIDDLLADLPLVRPHQDAAGRSALHLYPIQVEDRARVFAHLRENGIGVNVHYIPVHLQPHYAAMGFARGDFPVAEAYYDRAISLPLHPGLTEADQDRVVEVLGEALAG